MLITGWLKNKRILSPKLSFLILRTKLSNNLQIVCKDTTLFEKIKNINRESYLELDVKMLDKDCILKNVLYVNHSDLSYTPFFEEDTVNLDTIYSNKIYSLKYHKYKQPIIEKSYLLHNIRSFFYKQHFIEINTSKIIREGLEGGSDLFRISYFDKLAYLAQSAQLYKQALMTTGLEKIYEIAYAYRAEKSDTSRHLAEILMLDVEFQTNSLDNVMDNLCALIQYLTDESVKKFTYYEIQKLCQSVNVQLVDDFSAIHYCAIKQKLPKYYIIYEYPLHVKPFYIKKLQFAQGFDLMCEEIELASGGIREEDYTKLCSNMHQAGLDLSNFKTYLTNFKRGMPPHGGYGLGIDRLLQKICNLSDIRLAVINIRDKNRV